MKKHAFGAILLSILWSSLAFITLAAGQPSRRIPTPPPHLPQQTTSPDIVTAVQFDPVTINVSSAITTWNESCVQHRIEITGTGMGDTNTAVNPQTFTLTNPGSVDWLLAQVAGRRLSDLSQLPDSVTFSTSGAEMVTLPTAASVTDQAYVFETKLQSADQITTLVNQPGNDLTLPTPRGLILYARRSTTVPWTSVGRTTNQFVYSDVTPPDVETLAFQPLTQPTNLHITAVVIDNNDDERPLVLEASAGGVTASTSITGPTDGPLLNIVSLTLPQVPAGTDQAVVTLSSPKELDGDSLVLVGVNVSFRCGRGGEIDLGVNKTVSNPTPNPDEIITYTTTVINHSTDEATGIRVADLLPPGVTYISPYMASRGSYSPSSGLWAFDNLAGGDKATLTIKARVNHCGNSAITAMANILVLDQLDRNSSNDQASVGINVASITPCYIYLPIIRKNYCDPSIDTFDSAASGWPVDVNENGLRTEYNNSKYRMSTQNPSLIHFAVPSLNYYTNFEVEVDAFWANGSTGEGYGLVFGLANDNSRLYVYQINANQQQYRLLRRSDNSWDYYSKGSWKAITDNDKGWVTPQDHNNQNPIFKHPSTNVLRIIRNFPQIELYVNDELLDIVTDNTSKAIKSGQVGLGVQSYPDNSIADARFDNYTFESCDIGMNVIGTQGNSTKSTRYTGALPKP